MGYEPLCLVPAAGDRGQAYAYSLKLVCMVGCMYDLLANFEVGYPVSMRPQAKAGVSGGQSPCWHLGVLQVWSTCEKSVQVHASVC